MNYVSKLHHIALTLVAAYLRNTPVLMGRWRILRRYLPLLREIGPTMGERVVKTRHGFRMRVNLGEWIEQYVYLTGGYEPTTTWIISALIGPGDNVADVGAHCGFFTLLASRKVGMAGKVIAFEPVPSVRSRLEANIQLNLIDNVVVQDIALSNVTGTETMYEGPEANKGLSSIRPIDRYSATMTVPTAAFDSLPVSKEHFKLIKIDVEGAEQLVLEGMHYCLQRDHPHLIVEITDTFLQNFGHSVSSLSQWLLNLDYTMYEITEQGLVAMPAQPASWPRQFNALFTVEDDAEKISFDAWP